MQLHKYFTLILLVLVSTINVSYSQNNQILDRFISNNEFEKADSLLSITINELKQEKKYTDLAKHIYYYGKIQLNLQEEIEAIKSVQNFANSITKLCDSMQVLRQKHIVLGRFYVFIKDYKNASDQNLLALEATKKIPDATGDLFGLIHHNLSIDYRRLGDIKSATWHSKKSLEYYLSYPKSDRSKVLDAYNSLGARMWDVYKIDSALYYFKKGEDIIEELEPTPMNKFYHKAKTQSNISSIYSLLGNTKNASIYNEKAIKNYNNFIKSDTDGKDFFKEEAKLFLLLTIENYAADLTDQGNLIKARDLLHYVLKQKTNSIKKNEMEIAYTSLQLGNTYLRLQEFDLAETFINKGLDFYTNTEQKNLIGLADAYYYKGLIENFYQNTEKAKFYYDKSSGLYQNIFAGSYDKFYLDAMLTFSKFYSTSGYEKKAIEMATDTYNYILENQGEKTQLEVSHILNLAEIYYNNSSYDKALKFVNKGLDIINSRKKEVDTSYSFLTTSLKKPSILLIKSKIEMALNPDISPEFLKEQFKDLKQGIEILESQKTVFIEDENISMLIADNDELFELAKKIAIMLYEKTKDSAYLTEALSIHESKIYNKIRQQLNVESKIKFQDIPKELITEEQEIKQRLNITIAEEDNFDNFIKTNVEWRDFLKNLKRDFPKYYHLKYASIIKSFNIKDLQLKKNNTILRYVFLDDQLVVFVINKEGIQLYKLNATKTLNLLKKNELELKDYKALYDLLWKPIPKDLLADNIVIIPDAELFNLSFETIAITDIKNHKELADNCLLNYHNISYNYSLLLINENSNPKFFENNFIAFTPEFNDEMKSDYVTAIKDSILLDKTYMTLLPQPFSANVAREYSRLFDGDTFTNEKASKQVFTQQAREHKIIHIGTHAESNNVSPELSRLIFAKNLDNQSSTEDNYLYTYEIYNQNLASNLAILTACETGKPTYQAGEGMISLAHAFNYAGSESILTSLWKIDEQSSAEILKYFYDNLSIGLTKDEALKKAKLTYISNAEGRTIAPQYWAGLVLIGDTSPIDLDTSKSWIWWLIMGIIIILLFLVLIRNSKKVK